MRVGYGYNRIEKEFAHASCDRVWIDGQHTERQERSTMLGMGLRKGDTLVLLARGELTVDVCPPEKDQPKPRGRPKKFDPTPEQDEEIRRLWADPVMYTRAYVIMRATEITGAPVDRNALYHRYGKRE